MSNPKKPALGRGLSALLENAKTDITTKSTENAPVLGSISMIPLSAIETNPFQPRNEFEEIALNELAQSIKENGIIQPITVRKLGYDKYQIISGERRFRAAQIAGLKEIPAYIRVANDQQMLELALIENIQREDLNPIEIALSYQRLIEECKLTQEELSKKVGKQRSTVTNYLRLLKLPAPIQKGLKEGIISMGHARALINIENEDKQLALFALIVEQDLSVREVEELAKGAKINYKPKVKREHTPLTIEEKLWLGQLKERFDRFVEFKKNSKGGGKIILNFENEDDLNVILKKLGIE
ncbi:MAG: ParB/RepB/Spo0J family partition protein [Bacteroidetes bacterium]|nr:MAG: ParB/RepB/Spo0J family partition protein [Bacteroidota bacterium]